MDWSSDLGQVVLAGIRYKHGKKFTVEAASHVTVCGVEDSQYQLPYGGMVTYVFAIGMTATGMLTGSLYRIHLGAFTIEEVVLINHPRDIPGGGDRGMFLSDSCMCFVKDSQTLQINYRLTRVTYRKRKPMTIPSSWDFPVHLESTSFAQQVIAVG